DKYKKILDKICIDKMKLDGEMKKEEKEAIIKVKGEALIEKEDRGAFGILIQLEAKINLNALCYAIPCLQGTRQRGIKECKQRKYNVKPLKGRAYGAS
nr:hypothetical protein [Tanacetum cinerariifolium]